VSFAESDGQLLYDLLASFCKAGFLSKRAFLCFTFVQNQLDVCHCERYMISLANSNPKALLLPHSMMIIGLMPTELAAAHTAAFVIAWETLSKANTSV